MLRVGLTGGIATGKTTVGELFVEHGCHLIDSDQIGHQLFEPGQAVHAAVVKEFGQGIVASDGSIDRRILGEIVFKDSQARSRLNGLVHPAIIERQQEWLKQVEAQDPTAIAIVAAALMIEVGTYKNYDKIIVVTCTPEIQKERLRARSRLPEDQIEARIRSQMPMAEKVKYANFVIDNSGGIDATRGQVQRVHSELLRLHLRLPPLPPGEGPREAGG
jgi:dephospho-CoA kinase